MCAAYTCGVSSPSVLTVLTAAEAADRAAAHAAAVHARTSAHLHRRARGEKHPVEDFLYTYYPFTPGQLATWHPGAGLAVRVGDTDAVGSAGTTTPSVGSGTSHVLEDVTTHVAGSDSADAVGADSTHAVEDDTAAFVEALAGRKWYRTDGSTVTLDLPAWHAARGDGARFIRDLLERTLNREGTFGCFGLHEWAMVYKQTPDEVRHDDVPLRLTHAQTDQVVEGHRIRCSHFDAFRFFTPDAKPLNELSPERQTMREMEQPGCLHGGMDLYKWAMKLGPIVPSEVTLDAFDLASDIRVLDMEASPYDVRDWGYGFVAIETPEGKAEYVRRQREFAARGNEIRRRLIHAIDAAFEGGPPAPGRA